MIIFPNAQTMQVAVQRAARAKGKGAPAKPKPKGPTPAQQARAAATRVTNQQFAPALADVALQERQNRANATAALNALHDWNNQIVGFQQAGEQQAKDARAAAYQQMAQGEGNIANLFGGAAAGEAGAYGGVGTDMLSAVNASDAAFGASLPALLTAQSQDYARRAQAGFDQLYQTLQQNRADIASQKGAAYGKNLMDQQQYQLDVAKAQADAHYKAAALAYQQGNMARYQAELKLAQQKEARYSAAQQGMTPDGKILPGYYQDPSGVIVPKGYQVNAQGQVVRIPTPKSGSGARPSVADSPKRIRAKIAADAKGYWIGTGKNRRRPTYSEAFSYLYQKYKGYIQHPITPKHPQSKSEAAFDRMIDDILASQGIKAGDYSAVTGGANTSANSGWWNNG